MVLRAVELEPSLATSLLLPSIQLPQAICELTPGSINRNLLINRDKPPFDNRDLRGQWR
jgi:hypothetical protein